VLHRLLALPETRAALVWAVYAELPGEVPTGALRRRLHGRGTRVVLPRVVDGDLVLHRVGPEDALDRGYGGVFEPGPDLPVVPPESIDAFVVPGLLFDRQGFRLGRGGGHYDRLLSRSREGAARVGLCYAERVIAELPVDAWDERVDVVVTDRDVVRPAARDAEGLE
jgi:5-formyltetrahydrofolate cyclo-ligase